MPLEDSPFLQLPEAAWIASNALAFAIFDGFPVSPGHALVITRRRVASWFDASTAEQSALMALVNEVKVKLDATLSPKPDGYNVGFNSGGAAGQTVTHVHIHVIPRYRGDMPDPRGGVRHVIPHKGNYLLDRAAHSSPPARADLRLSIGHPDHSLWNCLKPRLAGAREIEVLASFVQLSGLDVIEEKFFQALRAKACIRILVGDYLFISDARALDRLRGWIAMVSDEFGPDRFDARLVETARLPGNPASFHPKAWRILEDADGLMAIGSSNLSAAALKTGVEWNLLARVSREDPLQATIALEYQKLWDMATPLTRERIARYAREAERALAARHEPESVDFTEGPPPPRPWQVLAGKRLKELRIAGCRRALISVATGLGKTWLAAFDAQAVGRELGRCPRVIVIAHRAEILAQAESVFRRTMDSVWPKTATSWCLGREASFEGPLVIASIQKLARPEVCEQLSKVGFDYAIIDEVHHAHAASYRRVLSKLQAAFALGLTATPERSDGVDVATLFDDVLAWHASIGDGIQEESLVPFSYIGLRDDVDYRQIPWRQGRFDPGVLEVMLENSRRMESLWQGWTAHPGGRTLVFCSSQRHAIYTRDWLRRQGVRAAAVFAAPNSDPRSESLDQLERGGLDAICAVDLFNEGVDLPTVDRVVMLRPTESRVLFLQQLGRGLRAAPGKSRLIVIDFVGNHRVFARRLIHLLSLHKVDAGWIELRRWLERAEASLPPECLLEVSVEARDLLRSFIPGGAGAAIEAYRGMRDEHGRRPTMVELFHRGYLPATIRAAHDQWFRFVEQEGDLDDAERGLLAAATDWFRMLETTALNRSFKMVVLQAFLDRGALWTGIALSDLGAACRRLLLGHRELYRDLEPNAQIPDHQLADAAVWNAWWQAWPVQKWTEPQGGRTWFTIERERFSFLGKCEETLRPAFEAMTAEVVEYRMAQYIRRSRKPMATGFSAKVSHSGGRPILFLPKGGEWAGRPFAWTAVTLHDGSTWQFKFARVACNVAHPAGAAENQLATLLRGWFGHDAGLPGTNFQVRFEPTPTGFAATPIGGSTMIADEVSVKAMPTEIVEFPALVSDPPEKEKYVSFAPVFTLEAAAGLWGPDHTPVAQGWMHVAKPKLSEGMFIGRVVGASMEPKIPSGSWCLFRRSLVVGSRHRRILLVQFSSMTDSEHGGKFTVKMYHSEKRQAEDGWRHDHIELRPLNPAYTPIHVTAEEAENLRIVGEFVAVVSPKKDDGERSGGR